MAGIPGTGSHPITQDLLDRSRRSIHQSIQRIRFHQPFRRWQPWVISVTFKGQGVTFPVAAIEKSDPLIVNHPITQDLLDELRRFMHQPIQRVRFHGLFWICRPWMTSMTFKGQGVNFLITEIDKSDPLTYEGHKGHPRSSSSKRLMKSHTLNRLVHRSSRSRPVDLTGGRRGRPPGPWPHLWLMKVGPYCHFAPPLTWKGKDKKDILT